MRYDRAMLDPLPQQRPEIPWPGKAWPEAEPDAEVDRGRIEKTLERLFATAAPDATGETKSLVIAHRGRIVVERYGGEYGRDTPFVSWSCAKSILHAVVGILVRDGKIDVDARADDPGGSPAMRARRSRSTACCG
jgi:CubicO group peptidase (beta-lactamase class C family)